MRVLVATDRYPGLTSARAGAALARAWAERGAQVAVVPVGAAGDGLGEALVDLWDASTTLLQVGDRTVTVATATTAEGLVRLAVVLEGGADGIGPWWEGSSGVVGQALRAALDEVPGLTVDLVVIDAGTATWQDGGRGMLEELGGVALGDEVDLGPARARLGGARLLLAVPSDQVGIPLVGLRGITSRAAHEHGPSDPALMLARDQRLVDLGAAAGVPELTTAAGSGAAGGLGWAVLALGGQVLTGPGLCRELSGLDATAARADLLVTGGDRLDFGTMGGDVLTELRAVADQVLRPLVVVAGENFISARELRSIGVEAAYPVRRPGPDELASSGPITEDELTAVGRKVAGTWSW